MSPFFTLQRQLSYEPERRLPVAVVAGVPPDPRRAREKLVIEALHSKLSYFKNTTAPARQLRQDSFRSLFGSCVVRADDDGHDDRDDDKQAAAAHQGNQHET